ncbi:MAG: tetratricopeptide repeat protein, partial [Bauldia sp.]
MTAIGRLSKYALLLALVGVVAFGAAPAAAQPARGDGKEAPAPAPPTPEQMEQAKQAFIAGKTLFDEKKLEEAVEKFKESYRLSRNPLLLYNVAFTLDQMGQKDLAVFYYKKFVSDAPADAAQRPDATARLKVLEKELAAVTPPDTGDGGDVTPPDTGGGGAGGRGKKPKADPSSYTPEDFQHQIVEDAPPGKPLDLTAFSPEDSGWIVTMFFRGAGEAKFNAVPMKPRYNELVARVPAKVMQGVSIQYYIEVRTPDAKIVTRIGKPSSPNIVYIDEKARPRYYP